MIIANEADFLQHLGVETREQAERRVYKDTDCGAWITFDATGVKLGSIVEGSDAEVDTDPLTYPFTSEQYEQTVAYIEGEVDILWQEANEAEEE